MPVSSLFGANPVETFLGYSERHRTRILALAGLIATTITLIDWRIEHMSIGFLYIIPMLLVSGNLRLLYIFGLSVGFSLLREAFTPISLQPGMPSRLAAAAVGFSGAGFFVSELNRLRRLAMQHLRAAEEQIRLREATEQQLRILIETSPLAIVILDGEGTILLANHSAHELLGFEGGEAQGKDIRPYLPVLGRPLGLHKAPVMRTNVECRGQRKDGEVFLAQIWLSTFLSIGGPRLAAVVWDGSENLRLREGAGLDSMIDASRILIGALSHEVRNLANSGVTAYEGLALLPLVVRSDEYQVLGTILRALEKISSTGLKIASDRIPAVANLYTVLDETRIVIEPNFHDFDAGIQWNIAKGLPLVQSDHHNLLQVFLNLARNSLKALENAADRQLRVEAIFERDLVVVRFRDSGCGIADPAQLFRPFQSGAHSTGLGLYISKEILLSSGGDLRYETQDSGSCFVVELWPVEASPES